MKWAAFGVFLGLGILFICLTVMFLVKRRRTKAELLLSDLEPRCIDYSSKNINKTDE